MKVLLGMSGGVDSAYAACELISRGYEVEGAVLVMHPYTELDDARRAARELRIPLHEIDCTEPFERLVKSYFVNEYLHARTPNPCILCNEKVKLEYLWQFARDNGFDRIATGHYARVDCFTVDGEERFAIGQGRDAAKDQSYMLYRLPQYILRDLLLPLDELEKSDVRAAARTAGITSSDKPDSQEICFLPDGNYAEYIESVAGKSPEGDFVSPDGRILGRHSGIIRYTVGQRKGLGIALGERTYVTDIDPVTSAITLSPYYPGSDTVRITDVVYSGISAPTTNVTLSAEVRLRHGMRPVLCEVDLLSDGSATIRFDSPMRSTPGQSAVVYSDGRVLLGGFIR